MMEHFIPKDSVSSDGVYHKCIGQQTLEPLRVVDDEEFTKQEILGVLEKFDSSKTPGGDGMNSDIYYCCRLTRAFLISSQRYTI